VDTRIDITSKQFALRKWMESEPDSGHSELTKIMLGPGSLPHFSRL